MQIVDRTLVRLTPHTHGEVWGRSQETKAPGGFYKQEPSWLMGSIQMLWDWAVEDFALAQIAYHISLSEGMLLWDTITMEPTVGKKTAFVYPTPPSLSLTSTHTKCGFCRGRGNLYIDRQLYDGVQQML